MSIGDIFWVFLIYSMVVPWIQQKMLDIARLRLMRRIEQRRGSRVILLIHRQETISFLGIPVLRYIDMQDAEEVIHAIRLTDEKVPLDIVLHTPGGLVLPTLQMARAIQTRTTKVTVFVPHYAMSGGTLLALAADEIVMDSHAVLGPVDPQLGEFPAASLLKVVKEKAINEIDDKTLIYADMAEKALHQIRAEVCELLTTKSKMADDSAAVLADKLSQGTWTHDHPIGCQEAQQLGLPVTTAMPKEIYELMGLYRQPLRRQPAVQYVPVPYGPPSSDGRKHR